MCTIHPLPRDNKSDCRYTEEVEPTYRKDDEGTDSDTSPDTGNTFPGGQTPPSELMLSGGQTPSSELMLSGEQTLPSEQMLSGEQPPPTDQLPFAGQTPSTGQVDAVDFTPSLVLMSETPWKEQGPSQSATSPGE